MPEVRLQVKLDDDLKKKLEKAAKEKTVSMSAYARMAVQEKIEREEKK